MAYVTVTEYTRGDRELSRESDFYSDRTEAVNEYHDAVQQYQRIGSDVSEYVDLASKWHRTTIMHRDLTSTTVELTN